MCDPFEVVGRTFSESNDGYGIVVRFAADRNSRPVREVTVSRAELVENGGKVIAYLADRGLWVTADKTAKTNLAVLLSEIKIDWDIVTYSRPGWHAGVFVSPTGEVFSNGDGQFSRLSEKAKLTNPTPAGTLDGWKRATSAALTPPDRAMVLHKGYSAIADARACMSVHRRIPDAAQRGREGRHMTRSRP
jgi:hypothetical protein